MDPIILGEVRYGILLLPAARGAGASSAGSTTAGFGCTAFPGEAATGLRWAELLARLRAKGRPMPVKDCFIAATALANRLTVVTRNVADFENAGCTVVDPYEP